MLVIGIDPGKSGAVAVISDNMTIIALDDTPTVKVKVGKKHKNEYVESEMLRLLKPYTFDGVHVYIEKVHSMPGQGVSSMFSMGDGYGLWRGMVVALGLPYALVPPQRWKKDMMDGMGKDKASSCIRAQQIYPDAELFTPRGRALDGRGDACLIATYGLRELNAIEHAK